MNILIAIPIYAREEISLNCIKSLLETTVVPNTVNVTVSIGINKASDDLKAILMEIVQKQGYKNIHVELTNFGKNIGKPNAVNSIANGKKFDYLVSLDGDMICIQSNWLIGMLSVYEDYNKNPIVATMNGVPFKVPMGALCGNQFGYSCHAVDLKHPQTKQIKAGSCNIVTVIGGGGIAGGVLMTDYATWMSIGGYDGKTIYGGDDGYYSAQCHLRKKLVAYVKEIGFYHPFEINKQYQDWKVRALQMITKTGPGLAREEMGGFF